MEAFSKIEAFKEARKAKLRAVDYKQYVVSKYVSVTNTTSMQVIVPENGSKDAHRKALWELALVRWSLFNKMTSADFNLTSEGLPTIFSYVNNEGQTVYFFTSEFSKLPQQLTREVQPHTEPADNFTDDGTKIPVTKLAAATAKKLFSDH